VRVYDEDTKSVIIDFGGADWNLPGHANRVFGVRFVHDNPSLLISSGWDRNILVWDLRAGESIA
jgi:WD40 repeat protein